MDLNDAQQSLLNTMAQSNSFALFQIIVFKSGNNALLNNIKRLFFLIRKKIATNRSFVPSLLKLFMINIHVFINHTHLLWPFRQPKHSLWPPFYESWLKYWTFWFLFIWSLLHSILKYTIEEKCKAV